MQRLPRQPALHGNNRNQVETCILCHTRLKPTFPAARRHRCRRIDRLRIDIHRIHAGKEQERDYTVYGYGNTRTTTTSGLHRRVNNCSACHEGPATGAVKAKSDITDPRGS